MGSVLSERQNRGTSIKDAILGRNGTKKEVRTLKDILLAQSEKETRKLRVKAASQAR